MPLAIIQAAAHMKRLGPHMPIMKYIVELRAVKRRVQLLHNAAPDMRRDKQALNSVLAMWQISFEHKRSKRPSAACLLSFMSFFNRQGIPEFMIRNYLNDDSDGQDDSLYQGLEAEAIDFEDDMAMLRAFSLVGTMQRADEFEMHKLIQLTTQTWLKPTDTERRWHQTFMLSRRMR